MNYIRARGLVASAEYGRVQFIPIKPRHAKPSHVKPNRATSSQAEPRQAAPGQATGRLTAIESPPTLAAPDRSGSTEERDPPRPPDA